MCIIKRLKLPSGDSATDCPNAIPSCIKMNTSTKAMDVETNNIETISTDTAIHAEEETCDGRQILGVGPCEYTFKTSPLIPEVRSSDILCQQPAIQCYHCARVRKDSESGSGSDSAKEEDHFPREDKQVIVPSYRGRILLQQKQKYDDLDLRLSTFINSKLEWPHTSPSAEEMAAAGMIFKGAYYIPEKNRTVYDMVECYVCGKRLYEFSGTDKPQEQHRRLYPRCQLSITERDSLQ